MPRFDGRGPQGNGSMTGGGRGYCALPAGSQQRPVRGGSFGRGRGLGRGFGRGLGRGFGWRQAGYAYENPYLATPYASRLTPQQEADELKAEAKAMQNDINAMNQRIKELEANTGSEGNE
jgi:Family of unknown function (DUF5320)